MPVLIIFFIFTENMIQVIVFQLFRNPKKTGELILYKKPHGINSKTFLRF